MFSIRFSIAFIMMGLVGCAAMAEEVTSQEIAFPDPPRLAVVKSGENFEAARDAAVKAAADDLANPVPLPEGYGSWIFYYACEDDGTTLRPNSLTEHVCPQCDRVYTDERTIAAYRCRMHHALEHSANRLGRAYAYTGDDAYAAGVKRILMHLANEYDSYPARLDRWGRRGIFAPLGGRRYVQTLDEAVGMTRLAPAYDLTRQSDVWSDQAREHVEENFFRATAISMQRFKHPHNHQTWYNAGLMHVANLLADEALVRKVLTMRLGVYDQLDNMVGDEGLWFEGTMAYHNYALQAMIHIADATRQIGVPVHEHPKFKAMILAPLRVAYPNGRLPAINDSDPMRIRVFRPAFEWGWDVYGDPAFARAMAGDDVALLREMLGDDAQPSPAITDSEVLMDAGLIVLRQGEGDAMTCVFLDFGPHGGSHGHHDKLNITLFANNHEWLLDPGRLTYSHSEYKTWVKTTAAHNTVVVDERDQAAHTGELLWFKQGDGWDAAAARTTRAYRGVTLTRYVMLTPTLLIDRFDVQANRTKTYDWFAHAQAGDVRPLPAEGVTRHPQPMPDDRLGKHNGYQHHTDAEKWEGQIRAVDWQRGETILRVWLDDAPTQTFTANGIGYYINQKTPTLIRRRVTDATRFVAVFDLTGTGEYIRSINVDPSDQHIIIETIDGAMHVTLDEDVAETEMIQK